MDSSLDFLYRFSSLGGRVAHDKTCEREFINLEQFLLDATIEFKKGDPRVNEALWCFFIRYGVYFSCHKISKLIKKNYSYDSSVLGAILAGIDHKFPESGDFSLLKKYTKKEKEIYLYSFARRPKVVDERFFKFGIIAPAFNTREEDHYLFSKEKVLKISPELRFRLMGFTVAVADLRSAIEIHGKKSIYFFAKITNLTYAHAYECVHRYCLLKE